MARVTVVGTGLLGSGIAEVLVRHRHEVVLNDFTVTALLAAHKKLTVIAGADVKVRAEPNLDDAVADAEFVVEAVTEDLALKQSLFERIGKINRRAILMSNSSVLPIGQIAKLTQAPERTVGTHWWNPPQLIPIVEVIRGPRTSEYVMEQTMSLHTALGKIPVRVDKDVAGFIGNRIQHSLWREALALVSESDCDPHRVDRIVADTLGLAFAKYGPWAHMQRFGWRRVVKEFERVVPLINSDAEPAKLLRESVAQGRLGAKTGAGFLSWPDGAREHAAARLSAQITARLQNQAEEPWVKKGLPLRREDRTIAHRLRVAVWREALSLIANNVCSPADLDRVVCNTIGLRLASMGPIENADYVGLDLTLAIHEAVLPTLESSTKIPAVLLANASLQQENAIDEFEPDIEAELDPLSTTHSADSFSGMTKRIDR